VRGGVWILIFIVSDQFLGFHDKLSALLYFWVLSVSISTVIGLTKLSTRFDLVKNIAQYDFSLLPIYRGVMVALPFFCTTIMYKLMEFFNRYVIKSSFGHEDVGIFSFYSMLASLSIIVSDILVFSFLYPQLIQATHTRNQELYTKTIKNMTIQSSTLFVVTSISTFIFIYFFGEFFIDIKIVSNINILIILLLSNFFLILSLTPNYIIYANGKDYLILKGTLLGFCCNILGSLLVIPLYGINGAAYVQLLSFFVLFCSKKYMLKKIPQNIN
jgi:O-antigen/teichoic acid export membrane protein